MSELIYKTDDGTRVAERESSHVHEGITEEALREALAKVTLEPAGRTAATVDLGRAVGETGLVEATEDEVMYAYRAGRPGPSRVLLGGEPEPTSLVTVVVAPPEQEGEPAALLTAFFGEAAPPEPWDDAATGDSRPFWEERALVVPVSELAGRAGSRDAYLYGHVRELGFEPPTEVLRVLRALEGAGFEAVLVGGCVRDALRGVAPDDFDVASQATPAEVREVLGPLGYHVIPTGLKHGTVTIPVDGDKVEVTTYRIDGEYFDQRHCEVEFTRSLVEDLARRDFTFNALALAPADDGSALVIDAFGGEEDLARGLVRCVGEPADRFGEDPLRMLRAMRFSARLGFSIDPATRDAALGLAHELDTVALERKTTELVKTLAAPHVARALAECAPLVFRVLPELAELDGFDQHSPWHEHDVWGHTVRVVGALEKRDDPALLLAALFHDCAKPDAFAMGEDGVGHFFGHDTLGARKADAIMQTRLRLPTAVRKRACLLVRFHELRAYDGRAMARLARRVGEEVAADDDVLDVLEELLYLRRADIMGQRQDEGVEARLAEVDRGFLVLEDMRAQGASIHVRDLAIGGEDVMALGVEEGPEVGRVLEVLLGMVVEGTLANDRDALVEAARELLAR